MAKGQSLQDPFLNALAQRTCAGLDLPGQRHQASGSDRFLRSVRGAAQEHRQPDGLQARDLDRSAGACRAAGRRRGQRRGDHGGLMPRYRTAACSNARAPVSAPSSCASGLAAPVKSRGPRGVRAAGALGGRAARRDHNRPARAARTALLRRQRQGRGDRERGARARRRGDPGRSSALAEPGAQSRAAERAARARSQRADSRHLRAARAQLRGQARGRARAAASTCRAAWCAAGPTSSARRAASACAAARRDAARDRPAAARGAGALGDAAPASASSCSATPAAAPAPRSRCRRWRWSATPMPASRRCFDALTGSDVYIADQLFATLDPTVRRVPLPGGAPVVLADTVGFIRELPHELVAAFQSTLQEARERASAAARGGCERPAARRAHRAGRYGAERDRRRRRFRSCASTTRSIGSGSTPRLERDAPMDGRARGLDLARRAGVGIAALREAIAERLDLDVQRLLDAPAAGRRARCARGCTPRGAVREERALEDGATRAAGGAAGGGSSTAGPRSPGVQLLEPCRACERGLCRAGAVPRIDRGSAGRCGALLTAHGPTAHGPHRYGMESARRRQEAPGPARRAG